MTNPVETSFETWFADAWPRLVSFAVLHTRDLQEAEDVASEAAARTLRRWRDGDVDDLTAFAFTVAMNLCRRTARRNRRGETVALGSAEGRSVQAEVRDPDLLDALRRLPRRQQLAVALHYLADLTQAQVAEAMGIAPGTAAALLNQARGNLRRHLGGDR